MKVELTEDDFDSVHEEILLNEALVEIRQKSQVIVYLKIKVSPHIGHNIYHMTYIAHCGAQCLCI